MTKRTWCSAIVACFVLAGCATGGPGPRGDAEIRKHTRYNDQTCTGAVCEIDVRVVCDPAPCVGVVDPKVLLVFRAGGPKLIRWSLKGAPGYLFANEKVNLDPAEFTCDAPGANRKLVTCRDEFRQQKTEAYEYTLKVLKESDGSVLTIDPWIVPR